MITVINGAPGSGKSKTAQCLFETTSQSAWVDGDWLLAINPTMENDDERKLRYKNISTLVKNYHENGFTNVFVSFVYMKSSDLQEQIDSLKIIDSVRVFALVSDSETLRNRHSEDTYKREEIESSIDLNNKIAAMEDNEVINNSTLSIEEVAKLIKEKLGKS